MFATRSPRTLLTLAALAMIAAMLAVGCESTGNGGDGDDNDPSYKPNKAIFRDLQAKHAAGGVERLDDGGISCVGHAAKITDFTLASSLAENDATTRASGYVIEVRLRDLKPECAAWYQTQIGMVKLALKRVMELTEKAWHETIVGNRDGEDLIDYDLYSQWRVTGYQLDETVKFLIDQWKKFTSYPQPTDLMIPVVLSDLQRSLGYDEKMSQVQRAMQTVVDDLEYKGEVMPLSTANSEMTQEQIETRKAELIAMIPDGNDVEVSFTFDYVSPRKLKSFALKSTRNEWLDPIAASGGAASGGRYSYSIVVPSHYIKKGTAEIPVRIVQADGRDFETTYSLRGKVTYSNTNIGLIRIKGFEGYLNNLTKRMSETIRLPGNDGRPTVSIQFHEPEITLIGRPHSGMGGAGLTFDFQIGLWKPNTKAVYYLPGDAIEGLAAFTSAEQVRQMSWNLCWQEDNSSGKWGSLDAIKVKGGQSRKVYVRVDWNNGKDTDVLLFNFENRNGDELTKPLTQADTLFSTTKQTPPGTPTDDKTK
ncbi:MAG: hypothetical protein AB7K09_00050 [Planctomycetota bacterium]